MQSFESQQYVFLWAWGRQAQEPPRAPHTLATPLSEGSH